MKRAILAVRAPSDDDMQRVIESLSSLPAVAALSAEPRNAALEKMRCAKQCHNPTPWKS